MAQYKVRLIDPHTQLELMEVTMFDDDDARRIAELVRTGHAPYIQVASVTEQETRMT